MKINEIPHVTAVIHTETNGSRGNHKSFEKELKEQQKRLYLVQRTNEESR